MQLYTLTSSLCTTIKSSVHYSKRLAHDPMFTLTYITSTYKCCFTELIVKRLTPTDKSAGDTSDIISDSSGVGTSNSDTTCSLQGGATVVCLQPYESTARGHLRLNQGDIVEGTCCLLHSVDSANVHLDFCRLKKKSVVNFIKK